MQKSAIRTVVVFLFLFILTVSCLFLFINTLQHDTSEMGKVNASTIDDEAKQTDFYPAGKIPLDPIVDKILKGTDGNYSIVIIDLKNRAAYTRNEHQVYQTASLYKLWIMATVYKQIENGTLHKQEILSESIPVLNNEFGIASESAERVDGVVTYSVGDALHQMITVSDNYAALLLSEKVGLQTVSDYLTEHGFKESTVGGVNLPTTTASDIALFLEKLYDGKLANRESTHEMIALLKGQLINRKMPKYLPSESIIAHKTGELDQYTHDAGIVYTVRGNYISVFLSKSDDTPTAENRIASLSESIYNYFMYQAGY